MRREDLPRKFQADVGRFYERVILPVLHELQPHADVPTGVFTSEEAFFAACEKLTFNMVAFEARRLFSLTLAGLFERQLRGWAQVHASETERAALATKPFDHLLQEIANAEGIDLIMANIDDTITELHLLANAVRHGEGFSAERLRQKHLSLWKITGEVGPSSRQSLLTDEDVQPSDEDFARYIRAVVRFWGLADKEINAVLDGPY
jgi:hypothetical protein